MRNLHPEDVVRTRSYVTAADESTVRRRFVLLDLSHLQAGQAYVHQWWMVLPYLTSPYGLLDLVEGLKMSRNEPYWVQVVRAGTVLVARVEDAVSLAMSLRSQKYGSLD